MTEILTESFCERCGTRYTFESAAPRRSRIGKVRTLGKGMKNFVLSDDSSFSEAMAEARSEQELAAVAHQLDAFHQTFNFCLTCRQYTCGECWNEADGRCLTCSPIPGMEEPAMAAAVLAETPAFEPEVAPAVADGPDEAWPDADLSAGRMSRALGLDEAEAEATMEAAIDDDLVEHPGIASAAVVAAAEIPEASEPEPTPVAGLAPGQSLEDAIAAYEAEQDAANVAQPVASAAPEPVAEPAAPVVPEAAVAASAIADGGELEDDHDPLRAAMAAAALVSAVEGEDHESAVARAHVEPAPLPEPVAVAGAQPEQAVAQPEPEPDPVIAEPEPEPEPVAAEPVVAEPVVAEPVVAEPARVDVVPQPVWPQPNPSVDAPAAPAPAEPVAPANPWLTVAPEEGDSPQWPAAPVWPTAPTNREMPATLAGRPLLPLGDAAGVWAASAREVLTGAATAPAQQAAVAAPTAQPCVSCGLSLSANARFCRRCGTRQG